MSWKDWVVMTYQFVGGLLIFLGGVAKDCYSVCDIPDWRPLKIQAGVVGLVVLLIIYYQSKPKKIKNNRKSKQHKSS
jgi:hypothetical protein